MFPDSNTWDILGKYLPTAPTVFSKKSLLTGKQTCKHGDGKMTSRYEQMGPLLDIHYKETKRFIRLIMAD